MTESSGFNVLNALRCLFRAVSIPLSPEQRWAFLVVLLLVLGELGSLLFRRELLRLHPKTGRRATGPAQGRCHPYGARQKEGPRVCLWARLFSPIQDSAQRSRGRPSFDWKSFPSASAELVRPETR